MVLSYSRLKLARILFSSLLIIVLIGVGKFGCWSGSGQPDWILGKSSWEKCNQNSTVTYNWIGYFVFMSTFFLWIFRSMIRSDSIELAKIQPNCIKALIRIQFDPKFFGLGQVRSIQNRSNAHPSFPGAERFSNILRD